MNKRTFSKRHIAENILLALKGALVGFGAIMPGISGGTLCVAFGMYQPLIELFSHPRQALQKHWLSLCVFLFGAGIGFIGLSGLAGWLLEQNSQAVTCAFIGLIVGTIPELWRDAGQKGRRPSAYFAMVAGFTLMLSLLLLFRQIDAVSLRPDFWGFLFCGVMWGVSFIVPGLSSSTLLLFFGLYQPMLDGISRLSPGVLLPLAVGAGLCLLILSRGVHAAYRKWYAGISHAMIGIVVATAIMILPAHSGSAAKIALNWVCLAAGAVVSYAAGRACLKLSQR